MLTGRDGWPIRTVVRVHHLDFLEAIVTVKGNGIEENVSIDALGLARSCKLATLLVRVDPVSRLFGRDANLEFRQLGSLRKGIPDLPQRTSKSRLPRLERNDRPPLPTTNALGRILPETRQQWLVDLQVPKRC